MALGLTNRGTGTGATGATTFTLSPGSNLAAGSLAVLCIAADNSSSGGTTNDLGAVTDSIGNTWTRQRNPIFDNGAASAGVQQAIYTTPQNVGALQTGTVITVQTPSSPVAKSWTLTEVTHAANAEAAVIGGADQAGATTLSPSFASSTIAVGDAVLFCVGMEAGTTQTATADADTTNGSWSTQQYAEVGSTTSGSCIASQGKVQTTTPSAQTYNPTLGISSDLLVSYVIIHEQHTASASAVLTGGGVLVPASTTARSRSAAAATGGGIVAPALSTARSRAAAAGTGGGVLAPVLTTSRARGAGAATGGGVLSSAVATAHAGSTSATGGGVVAAGVVAGRQASTSATGGGVFTLDYTRSAATENHDGTFAVTGGGAVALGATSARLGSTTATGGGIVAVAPRAGREASPAATAGGLATVGQATSRSAGVAVALARQLGRAGTWAS